MTLGEIIYAIEKTAPLRLQEKWDNSGLQIGLPPEADGICTGVLLSLDVNEDIVAEAVQKGCNLIISHHPLLFKGVKELCGRNLVQRTVAAAIRAGVAVYSSHIALDSAPGGVSYAMADLLGAMPIKPLSPAGDDRLILLVQCPEAKADDARLIILDNGADVCFVSPSERSEIVYEECGVEFDNSQGVILKAMVSPTQAGDIKNAFGSSPLAGLVAIVLIPVDGKSAEAGLGVIASFDESISAETLVARIKDKFPCRSVKASRAFDPSRKIRRIALCGGAGGEFIPAAAAAGVDAYITADIRYHDFADLADEGLILLDIGHFESESCFKNIFYHVITNNFPNFAVYYADGDKNPVIYL